MNKTLSVATTAVLAVLLAVPLGAAEWYSYGSYEPDTTLDDPAFNWQSKPVAGSPRIYFNAYTTVASVVTIGANPNVGQHLHTHIEAAGLEQHYAILGVWTDCNNDGYVGIAETGMREYPSDMLLGSTTCPAATGVTATCWRASSQANPCPASWPATGYNNARGWVTELIPIGNDVTAGDRRVIKDALSAVWGDYGRPDQSAQAAGGGTCAITPFPRGTMQSTGGLLTYADCNFGGAVAPIPNLWEIDAGAMDVVNTAFASQHRIFGVTLPGAGDPLGLRFADDNDGSTGTLGRFDTFGDEHSDNAIVHTGDCGAPYLVKWSDTPLGGPLAGNLGEGVRSPDTTYVNEDGSVAGTVNWTVESGPFSRQETTGGGVRSSSNCNFNDDGGRDFYSLVNEDDFVGVSNTRKTEADWNMEFQTMTRGGAPLGVLASGNTGAPNDAGLLVLAGSTEGPSQWFGGSTLTKGLFQTYQTRGTIADGDADIGIDQAYWLSFYANVGQTTLDWVSAGSASSLPGGSGTYGFDQCGAHRSGVRNGWECDPAKWNLNPDGSPHAAPPSVYSVIGMTYRLRDVDCYDGSIAPQSAAGDDIAKVGVQPTFYGNSPCTTV